MKVTELRDRTLMYDGDRPHFDVVIRDAPRPTSLLNNCSLTTGLELEVEGVHLDCLTPMTSTSWKVKNDHSLKVNGKEFVTKRPLSGSSLVRSVRILSNKLDRMAKSNGSPVIYGARTSLHVHLNFSNKRLIDVYGFVIMWLIFEPLIMEYCGDHRKSSIFCNPIYNSPVFIHQLINSFNTKVVSFTEHQKYHSINLSPLITFGSIEIRTRQGTHNPDEVFEWLNILYNLYNYSQHLIATGSINDVPSLLSSMGPMTFINSVMGKQTDCLINASDRRPEALLMKGVRVAQDVVYSTESIHNKES